MARLQILELPEGADDDRPPYLLVVDQADEETVNALSPSNEGLSPHSDVMQKLTSQSAAEQIGARGILVFAETIDIPANEVSLDENGQPLFLKVHLQGEFEQFRADVQDEIRKAQVELRQAINSDTSADVRAELVRSENARDQLREDRDEARVWARHGYEIGQRHCSWSDHGVAPAWLTKGWPRSFDNCEHLQRAAEYDEALTRVRAEVARIRSITPTWDPVADLIEAALNGTQPPAERTAPDA